MCLDYFLPFPSPEASMKEAVRLEGKDYIVQDGDIIYFRFAQ
jgi:ribosome-binding ATPase YchF (GTP1/OBG family)